MKAEIEEFDRRDGSRFFAVNFYNDEDEFLATVSFESIGGTWKDIFSARIWYGSSDQIRFPFDPKQPLDDKLMRKIGLRGWTVFEPAVKLAFGKVRSNPSKRSNPTGQLSYSEVTVDRYKDDSGRHISVDFWTTDKKSAGHVIFTNFWGGGWSVGVILPGRAEPSVWNKSIDPEVPFTENVSLADSMRMGPKTTSLMAEAFDVAFGKVRSNPSRRRR